MNIEVVPLTAEYFHKFPLPEGVDRRAYFSEGVGSLLRSWQAGSQSSPGGIVSMQCRVVARLGLLPLYRSTTTTSRSCFKEHARIGFP